MLVPAISKAIELREAFAREIYTDDYFYFVGEGHIHELSDFSNGRDYVYEYAVINDEGELLGYIAYRVNQAHKSVDCFGIYSFVKGNITLGKDLYKLMEELYSHYHRIEYRMVAGNHVETAYDNFCKRHNGRKLVLKDLCLDNYNNYHDSYLYEIINPDV